MYLFIIFVYVCIHHVEEHVYIPLYMCADPRTDFGSQCFPFLLGTQDQFQVIRFAWQLLLPMMSPLILLYLSFSSH